MTPTRKERIAMFVDDQQKCQEENRRWQDELAELRPIAIKTLLDAMKTKSGINYNACEAAIFVLRQTEEREGSISYGWAYHREDDDEGGEE